MLFTYNWFPNVPCVISAVLTPNGDCMRIVWMGTSVYLCLMRTKWKAWCIFQIFWIYFCAPVLERTHYQCLQRALCDLTNCLSITFRGDQSDILLQLEPSSNSSGLLIGALVYAAWAQLFSLFLLRLLWLLRAAAAASCFCHNEKNADQWLCATENIFGMAWCVRFQYWGVSSSAASNAVCLQNYLNT